MNERKLFASQDLTAGQLNALVKALGGDNAARDILDQKVGVQLQTKFSPWREFTVGGTDIAELVARIESHSDVHHRIPEVVLGNWQLTTSKTPTTIHTIILTAEQLGCRFERTEAREFLDRCLLADWCRRNRHRLPSGYVVDFLPAEAAFFIRDQYRDQPEGEIRIVTFEGRPDSYLLKNSSGRKFFEWEYDRAGADGWWDPSDQILLWLKQGRR